MPNLFDDVLPPKSNGSTNANLFDDILPPKVEVAPPLPALPPVQPFPKPREISKVNEPLQAELEKERAKQAKQVAGSGEVKTILDIGDTRGEVVPFWGSAVKAVDAVQLYNAATRYMEGRAKPEDEPLLRQHHADLQKPETFGYKVGSIAKGIVPFAGELLATAGIFTGVRKGVEAASMRAAEKIIRTAASSAAKKAATIASKVAGVTAGAIAQAPAAMPGEIVAKTYEELTPNITLEPTPEGGQALKLSPSGHDPLEATLIGTGNAMVETFTEKTGGAFARALAKLPGSVKLAALKEGIKRRWLRLRPDKTVEDFLKRTKNGTDWNGVVPELFEERLGEAIKPAVGIEEEYKPLGVKPGELLTKEGAATALRNAMAEGVAFLLPGAAALSYQKAATEVNALQRGRKLDQLTGQRASPDRKEQLSQRRQDIATESIIDSIMDAGREAQTILGGQNAERIGETETVHGDVLNAPGPQESPGQVPTAEGGVGISPLGQGEVVSEGAPVQAQEPVTPVTPTAIKVAEAEAATNIAPTEAQKESGNFAKGKVSVQGLPIAIENPKGSIRTGKNKDGTTWENVTPATYGYFRGVDAKDGDKLDVYLGENPESGQVFVVNQKNADTGKFDEHKAMLGFNSREEAVDTYTRAFSDGKGLDRIHSVVPMTIAQFKEWIKTGERSQPIPPVEAKKIEDELDEIRTKVAELSGKPGSAKQIRTLLTRRGDLLRQIQTQVDLDTQTKIATTRVAPRPGLESPRMPPEAPLPVQTPEVAPPQVSAPQATPAEALSQAPVQSATQAQTQAKPAELSKSAHKRFVQAMGRAAPLMNQAGITGIRFVNNAAEAGVVTLPDAVATITPAGQVVIIVPNFQSSLKGMKEEEAVDWMFHVLTEEAIHHVTGRTLTEEELELLWDSLPAGTRSAVLKDYSGKSTLKEAGMTRGQAGHEYIRGLLQMKFFGTRTEGREQDGYSGVTGRVLDALRRIVEALKRLAGLNTYADQAVARVEAALNSKNPAAAVAASEGPMPAALMSKPEQRRQELVAQAVLPRAQIDLINRDAYVQNVCCMGPIGGPAMQAFARLPAEVRSHIDFVRERFLTIRQARARLPQVPVGNTLEDLVNDASKDPNVQSQHYFWAWRNLHEFRESELKTQQALERAESELENMEKAGGVGTNPVHQFIKDAFNTYKNGLIAQRATLLASGARMEDVTKINAEIRNLDNIRYHTPTYRVARAVLENVPLSFADLGVNPTLGAYLAPIFQNAPQLGPAQASLGAVVPTPEILSQRALVNELQQATAFLAQHTGSPQFRQNYAKAADAVQAEGVVRTNGETHITFVKPGPPGQPNTSVQIDFSPEKGVAATNLDNLLDLGNEWEAYQARPDADPLYAAAYRHHHASLNFLANPAFSPEAGKLMPNKMDIFHALTIGGWLGIPESKLDRIGGMAAAAALLEMRNYDHMAMLARTRFDEMHNRINLAAVEAAKGHNMPIQQYSELVLNPIIASAQETGSARLVAGSIYEGRRITQRDMDVAEMQKNFVQTILREIRKIDTTGNRFSPIQVKVDGLIPYFRDPQVVGPLIMPRYSSRRAYDYGLRWSRVDAQVRDKTLTKDQARGRYSEILGVGVDTQAFYDLVVGHMRDACKVPSYAARVKTPFKKYYLEMTEARDRKDPNRPRQIEEVVRWIFNAQSGIDPSKQLSLDEIEDVIQKEIGLAMAEVKPKPEEEDPAGHPVTSVDIITNENFLVKPRGEQVLPSTLLEYAVTDRDSQARVVASVNQVLGNRYVKALERVATELDTSIRTWERRITTLTNQGVKDAGKRVRQESREAQLRGDVWYNFEEAKFHLRQVQQSIFWMSQVTHPNRWIRWAGIGMQIEESMVATKILRSVFLTPLLQSPGVILRNQAGGQLLIAQQEMLFANSVRTFGFMKPMSLIPPNHVLNQPLPGSNIVRAPAKMLAKIGIGVMRMFTPFVMQQMSKTKGGKQMADAIRANPVFWGEYTGAIFRALYDDKVRYDKLQELGLAGGSPWLDQMHAYWAMKEMGGRITFDDPNGLTKFFRYVGSAAGAWYEAGIMTASPRGALSKGADARANIDGMKFLDSTMARLEQNALICCAAMEAAGVTLDERTFFSAAQLVGSKWATDKEAAYHRLQFQKGGVNLDRKFVEFYKKAKAARDAGQTQRDFRLLDEAERNSMLFVFVETVNKGGFSTRPEAFTQSEFGRNFGALMGYGMALSARYSMAYSKFSRTRGAKGFKGWAEGAIMLLPWMAVILFASVFNEELFVRPLQWLLWRERRQVPRLTKAEDAADAFDIAYKQTAPFAPMAAGLFNHLVAEVRPSPGLSTEGIRLVPLTLVNSLMDGVKDAADTGNAVDPAIKLTRQWQPNARMWINRWLPNQAGLTRYHNTTRSLRAAAPNDVEIRKVGGSEYRLSPISDNIEHIVSALSRYDGPDMEVARRERDLAVEQLLKGERYTTQSDAEEAVDQGVLARTPYRSVMGKSPTSQQRAQFEAKMEQDEIEDLYAVENGFKEYAREVKRPLELENKPESPLRRSAGRPAFRPGLR